MKASSARRSTARSISTTSGAGCARPITLVAVSNSAARSTLEARSNDSSTRSSRSARSAPPRAARRRCFASTPASRSSWSVRASARGKPGVDATGAKYFSERRRVASNAALAATASAPSQVLGVCPSIASATIALRAASCVRLTRCNPKVAGTLTATARARSSAAPRDAPTISVGKLGERARRTSRAADSRSAAREETMMRKGMVFPGHRRASGTAAPRCLCGGYSSTRRDQGTRRYFDTCGICAIVSSTVVAADAPLGNTSRSKGGVTIVVTSTTITDAENTSVPMSPFESPYPRRSDRPLLEKSSRRLRAATAAA